ncbi:MAG: hypothetical protein KatS3mg082_3413 [Nitrospiraceae bacterium]|nr:MAG: hypothetical protein KatS3mg082_3413 [Nitrospiraceae bacterium]
MSDRRVSVVGPLPPPVHGMAVMNQRVADVLEQEGFKVARIDTSPRGFGFSDRLGRPARIVVAARELGRAAEEGARIAWLSVSGGFGKAYEIALVRLARRLGMRIVLHHHAWTNVAGRSRLMALLTRAAGPHHIQIALCERMAQRLRELYRPPDVRVVSNLAFLDLPRPAGTRKGEPQEGLTLGFIGNITLEKGIDTALAVAERVLDAHPRCRMIVAGPLVEARAGRLLREAMARQPRIEYRGPVYGLEKAKFFAEIDVLLFPSRYRNEAEPLAVYEALCAGTMVISTTVGCVNSNIGVTTLPHSEYVQEARGIIAEMMRYPKERARRTHKVHCQLQAHMKETRRSLTNLLSTLEDGT